MKGEIIYGFWFWSDKLSGIIHMLSKLSTYPIDDGEIDIIKERLRNTNDELNH